MALMHLFVYLASFFLNHTVIIYTDKLCVFKFINQTDKLPYIYIHYTYTHVYYTHTLYIQYATINIYFSPLRLIFHIMSLIKLSNTQVISL